MMNLTPSRYRGVAIAHVDFTLDTSALEAFFLGREVYRRTEYVVVVSGNDNALIQVEKASEEPLFSPVTQVEVIATPTETVLIRDPEVDTGVPSSLARAAHRYAPGKRCVIVIGTYGHLSFILEPRPIEIVVRDVVPPHPAKLIDQARRIIAVSEDLPPIELIPEVTDLDALIDDQGEFLLPCAGAATRAEDDRLSYLDQRPSKRDWTMIGCARSQQIHTWFYGEPAPSRDFCPKRTATPDGTIVLSKCCMLEFGMEVRGTTVYVPWGSTLDAVREGLDAAVALSRSLPATQSPSRSVPSVNDAPLA